MALATIEVEGDALEMHMRRIGLHPLLQTWIWKVFRLKGFRYAMIILDAWEEKT